MKSNSIITLIFTFLFLTFYSGAFALELGKNITVYDGQTADNYTWYTGQGQGNEDEETEPGTARYNTWDLEGMFLDGTVLSMVGEWDFTDTTSHYASDTYDRDGDNRYTSGDLFIDIAGIDVGGFYGYDYVFDVDWASSNHSYSIYSLSNTAEDDYLKTTYKEDSNPWKFTPGTNSTAIYNGSFEEQRELSNADVGFAGDNTHYVVSFDLAPILTDLSISDLAFTAHFTMECGNDNLMGTAPVPEPATIILMGLGLIGIGCITRRKFIFNDNSGK